jgi:hypothetical protein
MIKPASPIQLDASAAMLLFEIRRQAGRWVVRLSNNLYGQYLNRQQACLDAIEAATEARQTGQEAEVWDRSTNTRVF